MRYRGVGVGLAGVCALMLWAGSARAAVQVAVHDWEINEDLLGWDSRYDVVSVNWQAGGAGGSAGYLRATFAASEDPGQSYDVVYVSASSLFAGSWKEPGLYAEFDFMADDAPPDHLQIWWGADGHIWKSGDLDFAGGEDWSTVTGPLFESAYWSTESMDAIFADDLGAIDWIGVYIWRGDSTEQIYGIDNFRLMIPEPGEWIMLAAALAVVAYSRRRRERAPATVRSIAI